MVTTLMQLNVLGNKERKEIQCKHLKHGKMYYQCTHIKCSDADLLCVAKQLKDIPLMHGESPHEEAATRADVPAVYLLCAATKQHDNIFDDVMHEVAQLSS